MALMLEQEMIEGRIYAPVQVYVWRDNHSLHVCVNGKYVLDAWQQFKVVRIMPDLGVRTVGEFPSLEDAFHFMKHFQLGPYSPEEQVPLPTCPSCENTGVVADTKGFDQACPQCTAHAHEITLEVHEQSRKLHCQKGFECPCRTCQLPKLIAPATPEGQV